MKEGPTYKKLTDLSLPKGEGKSSMASCNLSLSKGDGGQSQSGHCNHENAKQSQFDSQPISLASVRQDSPRGLKIQNKPKILRFQSKIKQCLKKQSQISIYLADNAVLPNEPKMLAKRHCFVLFCQNKANLPTVRPSTLTIYTRLTRSPDTSGCLRCIKPGSARQNKPKYPHF
jgi:hypothetical protein